MAGKCLSLSILRLHLSGAKVSEYLQQRSLGDWYSSTHLKTLSLGRTLTMAVPYSRSLIRAIMLPYQMSAVLSSWSMRMKSGASA